MTCKPRLSNESVSNPKLVAPISAPIRETTANIDMPSWYSALTEYKHLQEEIGLLEEREHECECDANNFHSCSLCQECSDKSHRSRILMDLWGDTWASFLWQADKKLKQLGLTWERGRGFVYDGRDL